MRRSRSIEKGLRPKERDLGSVVKRRPRAVRSLPISPLRRPAHGLRARTCSRSSGEADNFTTHGTNLDCLPARHEEATPPLLHITCPGARTGLKGERFCVLRKHPGGTVASGSAAAVQLLKLAPFQVARSRLTRLDSLLHCTRSDFRSRDISLVRLYLH